MSHLTNSKSRYHPMMHLPTLVYWSLEGKQHTLQPIYQCEHFRVHESWFVSRPFQPKYDCSSSDVCFWFVCISHHPPWKNSRCSGHQPQRDGVGLLVMSPTRELAQQIEVEANRFGKGMGMFSAPRFAWQKKQPGGKKKAMG